MRNYKIIYDESEFVVQSVVQSEDDRPQQQAGFSSSEMNTINFNTLIEALTSLQDKYKSGEISLAEEEELESLLDKISELWTFTVKNPNDADLWAGLLCLLHEHIDQHANNREKVTQNIVSNPKEIIEKKTFYFNNENISKDLILFGASANKTRSNTEEKNASSKNRKRSGDEPEDSSRSKRVKKSDNNYIGYDDDDENGEIFFENFNGGDSVDFVEEDLACDVQNVGDDANFDIDIDIIQALFNSLPDVTQQQKQTTSSKKRSNDDDYDDSHKMSFN